MLRLRLRTLAWRPLRLLLMGLGLTLMALLLHGVRPAFLRKQELLVYDTMLRLAHRESDSSGVVIVDIDEASLRDYGQWPWPRYRVAQLLERIAALEPRVVGLDMVFAEPDGASPLQWRRGLEQALGLPIRVEGLPRGMEDFDAVLARALEKGPFVLGYKLHTGTEDGGRKCLLHPLSVLLRRQVGAPEGAEGLVQAQGAACNLPSLSQAAGASGFFNIVPDPDGVLRRMPMLMRFGGGLQGCLALAMLAKAEGRPQMLLSMDRAGPTRLSMGHRELPLDPRGNLLIHFRGRGGRFEYLSAAALLRGEIPGERLRGRYVLVGTSAAGLRELRATPFDGAFNGVEVHAAVLDNLLRGDFLGQPSGAWAWEALAILGVGLLASLSLAHFGARSSGVISGALVLAILGGALLLLRGGIYLQPLLSVVLVLGIFALLTWWKSRLEEAALEQRKQELIQTQDLTIHSMAVLGEARDPETAGHLRRTQHYMRILANSLRVDPRCRAAITEDYLEALCKMAPLHDIGKIGIPDRILLKPEELSPEEYEEMKSHTLVAGRIFEEARVELGPNSFLTVAEEVCRGHHERWDGSGYPLGLKGEAIPLAARLMALVDVYDAMVSQRVYKEAIDPELVAQRIQAGAGSLFDPVVVEAFLRARGEFFRVVERFR